MKSSNSFVNSMMNKVDRTNTRGLFVLSLFLLIALLAVSFAVAIEAAPGIREVTITTNEDLLIGGCDDDNDLTECSLRDAIVAANASQRLKRIELPSIDGAEVTTYTLTIQGSDEDAAKQGDLDIKKDLEIVGQGAGKTVIVGMGDRIIEVLPNVALNLSDLTIHGGMANIDGGAIRNRGMLEINNSVLSSNQAGGNGGAIWTNDSLSINRSALVNNVAGGDGGAIYADGGSVSLINSTISGNNAGVSGSAIYNGPSVLLDLSFVTLTNNTGGLSNYGSATYGSTIFAGNTDNDCSSGSGTTTSNGYNLFGTNTGCSTDGSTDLSTSDALLASLSLVPLEDGNGETFVHELLPGSPAADQIPSDGTNGCGTLVVTDQRGETRPLGTQCEIGAYEALLAQTGPIFENNTIDVTYDGVCGFDHCNLREAIEAANNKENDVDGPDEIHFNIPGTDPNSQQVILVTEALPAITDPVIISGTTQVTGTVVLEGPGGADGACNSSNFDGLTITGADSVVSGMEIRNFPGDGVSISQNGGNTVIDNNIHDNGGAGVCVDGSLENPIRSNTISTNTVGISLINSGNKDQQAPTLTVSIVRTADFTPTSDIGGYLQGDAGTVYDVDVFSNPSCTGAQGQTFLASTSLTTDKTGLGTFLVEDLDPLVVGAGTTATVTDPAGNTSEFSGCKPVETLNDSWLTAKAITNNLPTTGATSSQFIFQTGQPLWFKFPVVPDGKVTLTIDGQPGTIMTLHRNLFDQYDVLENADNAAVLAASDLPAGYLPAGYLPAGYLPAGYLPAGYLPAGYLPAGYLPAGYLPAGYLPAGYLPAGYLPAGYLPAGYLPAGYLPAGYLPPEVLPAGYLPELYSGSIRRSMIALADDPAATEQDIVRNTWNMSEELYVQIGGPASLSEETTITVTFDSGLCENVNFLPLPDPSDIIINGTPPTSGHSTLIIWDSARMVSAGSPQSDVNALATELSAFASRADDIDGVVIDMSATDGGPKYPRVAAANAIADANTTCVTAKNDVAREIKRVIEAYRAADSLGDLEYVVLVGSDYEIPFFRYPDEAGLANENEYVPPVGELSASEAALRRGQVLGQDAYGASFEVTRSGYSVPLPELAVGRLLRTAQQVMGMIQAYETTNGLVTPGSALATGYDFVADVGQQAELEFSAGLGGTVDSLITPQEDGLDNAWTADQLRAELFDKRHDLVFMAGHFTAGSLVAADYQTQIPASEVVTGDFTNSIILGLGCHGGYSIPGPDAIDQSPELDWPEIFLAEGATLVASTGYAYGDTTLLEYGELLFLNLIQQMRGDTLNAEVPIGKALVTAKLDYFSQHPTMEGIDDKTVLETTLYGFPMLRVNMPVKAQAENQTSIVSSVAPIASGEETSSGLFVGQATIDNLSGQAQVAGTLTQESTIQVTTDITRHDIVLTDTISNVPRTVTYFEGGDGVVARPAEPIYPLERRNVDVPGYILRGVGFYGGNYTDNENIIPATSAPTTENSRARPAFFSDVYYPSELASPNFVDTVGGGSDRLNVTVAQYQSESCASFSGTMRIFNSLDFRAYYLPDNWTGLAITDPVRLAALAAAPEITSVSSTIDSGNIQFRVIAQGDPAAPVEAAWITWTAPGNNSWGSIDLTHGSGDVWETTVSTSVVPTSAVFMAQVVNAGGLVSQNTNDGAFFTIGAPPPVAQQMTSLSFQTAPPTSGAFGETLTFFVELLDSSGTPVNGQQIILALGGQRVCAETDSGGIATFNITLSQSPGDSYLLRASFRGDPAAGLASSTTNNLSFEILRDTPTLTLEPSGNDFTILSGEPNNIAAVLTDSRGEPLPEKTISFTVSQGGTDTILPIELKTDLNGRVALGVVDSLDSGTYVLTARFIGFDEGGTLGLFDDVLLYNSASATASLTVNGRPAADAGGPYQVDEGSSVILDGSGSTDEGSIESYEWDFNYDGNTFDIDALGVSPVFDAQNLDGPSSTIVALQVTDDFGATHVDTATITINNVAPIVSVIDVDDNLVPIGAPLAASASFTDVGILDSHSAVWDWGDGNTCSTATDANCSVVELSGTGTVTGSHIYTEAGFYDITLTIIDDDGDFVTTVFSTILVGQTGTGKVIGGGRILVPSQACINANPYCSGNGNANIGFDAQYADGSTVPTGQMSLNYKGGGLSLFGDVFDALLFIDGVAVFRGQGSLSTSSLPVVSVIYEVTAIDSDISNPGEPDRFGIKIWYLDSGELILDTGNENLDPLGTIEGSQGASVKIS
jgi:parallel beta-helix repeat protein/predicted outer membrane repeat protein